MTRTSGPDLCRKVREGLTEYLDDALSPARRQGIETHLAACAECDRALQHLRRTVHHLSSLPGAPVPPGLRQTLLRALRDRPGR